MPARIIEAKPWKSLSIRAQHGRKIVRRGCAAVHTRVSSKHRPLASTAAPHLTNRDGAPQNYDAVGRDWPTVPGGL
jgi:hypothetical protein